MSRLMSNLQPVHHVLVIEDPQFRRTIALEKYTYSVGRHSSNDVVLHSKLVSRKHATLMRKEDGDNGYCFWLIDGDTKGNRSNNGIYVNGRKILEGKLNHGDVIQLGSEVKISYHVREGLNNIIPSRDAKNQEQQDSELDSNQYIQGDKILGIVKNPRDFNAETFKDEKLMKLASFPELTPNPILEIDREGRVTYLNPAARLKLGNLKEENIKHPFIAGLLGQEKYKDGKLFFRVVKIGEKIFYQYFHYVSEGQLIRSYIFEVRSLKRDQEMLEDKAGHDFMTGLPNRQYFKDQLATALANGARNDNIIAVLFANLDGLKNINETLGDGVGDRLLKSVGDPAGIRFAARLRSCLRAEDTVVRWGDHEFTVLLPKIESESIAAKVSQRIIDTLQEPFDIDNHKLDTTCLIGIALYPQDGEDPETLVNNAHAALVGTRKLGPNSYYFYTRKNNLEALTRLHLENLLHNALEGKEFLLHYQPQINIKTGATCGIEALLRWQNAELGLVYPEKFLAVAERTGLILPIGEWVLQTACAQSKAWLDAGFPPIKMSVNLSPRQFQDKNLVTMVSGVLEDTGLAPHLLELEITERSLMEDDNSDRQKIKDLQKMGVKIAMDDFGTGYSSLAYLRKFPFDTLRIDQTLVQDIKNNPRDLAFMSAIIALARCLKLRVLAEGVETQEQLELLRGLECEEMQGNLFSKPITTEEVTLFLDIHCTIQMRYP